MGDNVSIWNKQLGLVLVVLTIISICASAVIAYAVTDATANHNSKDIEQLKQDSMKCKDEISNIKTDVAVLNTVAEDVKEIKQDVKQLIRGNQ